MTATTWAAPWSRLIALGATHLFGGPGTMNQVTPERRWFTRCLAS